MDFMLEMQPALEPSTGSRQTESDSKGSLAHMHGLAKK